MVFLMKTRISRSPAVALSLALSGVLSAHAQGNPSADLQETVVTATRVQQPITDVVADVSIIDREQIDRLGATSVTQLLATLPGLQALSFGDSSRIYIRGAESRMTALYVDGVRVDSQDGVSALGGGVPWDLVPVSQIERIEVLRGPASAVYGSDAMGGVVQIFTRRGEAAPMPYMSLGAGSFNLKNASAGVSGAQGGWDYALGLGYESSDGFNTRPDLIHTPSHEAYAQKNSSLRLGYQIAAAHRVELSALDSQLDSQYVPWGGGTDYKARGNLTTSALKWKAQWSEAYSSSLTLTRSRIAKQDDVPFDYQTVLESALFENKWRLAGGTLTAALEQKKDEFASMASGFGDPAFQGKRSQNGLALGYGTSVGLHSVQLNLRSDKDSLFGTRQTGSAAYAYAFAPKWRATVSSGTAFRAPTLEQIYGPYGSVQLAPESNRSNELGVRYENGASTFKAVAYRNAITNLITSSQTLATCSAGFFCYYNVGQASIRGATISGTHVLGQYALRASLDVLDPRNDINGKVLNLRAKQALFAGAERRLGAWRYGADVQVVGQRFDDAANTTVLPGYALLNLNASHQLDKDWRLVMRVNNAGDVAYKQVANYATPGRTIYLGLQWQARP
jgi:vitamin B12 transporter